MPTFELLSAGSSRYGSGGYHIALPCHGRGSGESSSGSVVEVLPAAVLILISRPGPSHHGAPWSLVALVDKVDSSGARSSWVCFHRLRSVATGQNWGTVRQALIRGQRSQYLTLKLFGLVWISRRERDHPADRPQAIGILVLCARDRVIAGEPVTLTCRADRPPRRDGAHRPTRGLWHPAPYALLAFCLTVVSRSTAMGVAGILVFLIGEASNCERDPRRARTAPPPTIPFLPYRPQRQRAAQPPIAIGSP